MRYSLDDIYAYLDLIDWDEALGYNMIESAYDNTIPAHAVAGASQGCIVPDEEDYVIKFPLDGNYVEDDDMLIEFQGAEDGGDGSNYSEAALLIYERAKAEGLEDFFAALQFFSIHKGHRIYLQEKCTLFNCADAGSATPSQRKDVEKTYSDNNLVCVFSTEFNALLKETYGEELFIKFIHFIDDNDIGDLHNSNIGFKLDGSPCLIDYASYRE